MTARRGLVVTGALVLVTAAILLILSLAVHRHLERALTDDWRLVVGEAGETGLALQGQAARRSGWGPTAELAILRPRLAFAPNGPSLTSDLLLLERSALAPARIVLRLPRPVTIEVGASRWRVWGKRIAIATSRTGPALLDAVSLEASAGGGPDDVLTVAKAAGEAGEQDGQTHLSLRLDGVVLPLARTTPAERTIGQARLAASWALASGTRRLTLHGADLDWNGLAIHLAGTLAAGPSGSLSGRLALGLGPGWRRALATLSAARIVTPAEARAATGLLALVAPSGGVRDLPLAVQDGRLTFGGLLLLRLGATANPASTAR